MAKPRFGTVGNEGEILELIRKMNADGKQPVEILRAITAAGHLTRSGTPFSAQGVQSLIIDCDRARRVKLDLRQRSSRLSESLAEVQALSKVDSSCAKINARVQSLQAGGLPQVEAIAEAVGAT